PSRKLILSTDAPHTFPAPHAGGVARDSSASSRVHGAPLAPWAWRSPLDQSPATAAAQPGPSKTCTAPAIARDRDRSPSPPVAASPDLPPSDHPPCGTAHSASPCPD